MRLVVAAFALALTACAAEQPAAPVVVPHTGAGSIVRVVDGDTLVVRDAGVEETVRLIGIDTPEVSDPRGPVECFGREASLEMHRLADRRRVRLEDDVERRDRYKRRLAYVYRDDGLFLNAEMVRTGFAVPMTVPPNVAHAAEFTALAAEARATNRGLWRLCGG